MLLKRWLTALLSITLLGSLILSPVSLAKPFEPPSSPTPKTIKAAQDINNDRGIYQIQLPSGQRLYIKEAHDQPIVTIDTWVATGSVNETENTNGVSHFLEHLLFKGTDRFQVGEIDRLIESKGGNFNAATSDDFTHYYITTATPFFKEALDLHANMLLQATIPAEELKRERKVVQEEINRANDNPKRRLLVSLSELLFKGHGYTYDTLGPKELIGSVPRERILNYYHYWYQPKNFQTVIVGDVNTADVVELVKKAFPASDFPPVTQGTHAYIPPKNDRVPALTEVKTRVIEDPNVSQAYLALAFIGPNVEDKKDTYALDTAMMALGTGQSSRLYRRLKEETNLVKSISAGNWTQKYAGLVYVLAELKPENLDEAKQAVFDTLNRLKQTGITLEELEKSKTQTIKDFVFLNETTDGVASSIGYNVIIGDLSDYTDYVPNLQKVTLTDAKKALNRYLTLDRAVLVEVVPEGTFTSLSEEEARLKQQLLAAANPNTHFQPTANSMSAPKVTKEVLPNGMTLISKPRKESETVALRIFIRGGKAGETLPGTSQLLTQLLKKGTLARNTEAINRELESRGMNLSISNHDDYIEISADAVYEDLGELFLVLQDIMRHPTFPTDEITKAKEHLALSIQSSRDQPASVAMENLNLALYPYHPYGNIGRRVESHLKLIDAPAIQAYFDDYFVPTNMVVSAVGQFQPEVLKNYLLSAFPETLNKDSSLVKDPMETPVVPPLKEDVIIRDGKSKQSATWIAQGWLGTEATSEDYATLKVINSLLGSGLSSRLFVNLREKQGLAYVVSSSLPSVKDKSRFVLYIGTDPKNQKKVIQEFQREINSLKDTPVPEKELQEAKNKLSGGFALAHETNSNQSFYLGFYELMGMGYEFDQCYPEHIQKVTAADVQQVAQKYFSQPMVLSIVAPPQDVSVQASPQPTSTQTNQP